MKPLYTDLMNWLAAQAVVGLVGSQKQGYQALSCLLLAAESAELS